MKPVNSLFGAGITLAQLEMLTAGIVVVSCFDEGLIIR